MIVRTNTKQFEKQMQNIVEYSFGFLDGVHKGKKIFFDKLGKEVVFALGQYIDINAKANPSALHHVYEWYQTGSPSARLFDIDYTVSGLGLSLNSKFRQSRSMSQDGNTPFYNKASIMENGIPVVIKPKRSSVLAFQDGGQTVFTKKPVTVRNPGGDDVSGSFERTFDEFMLKYFKQSFLRASGLYEYINNPIAYKKNIRVGSRVGRSKGTATGFKWITNARIGVE
jgi:hypothetical protein